MRTGTLAGAHSAQDHDQTVDDGLDRIELRGLAAHGYHGVHEHERRDGQRFVVDVVAHTDTRPAAADDDLTRTLDYGVLASQVVAVLTGPPVALLETLAERIAATVLAHPQAVAVDVTVHKPQAPLLGQPDAVSAAVEFADVVVSVRRDRTRVPVVDPAGQADPAPRAGWASAAPAPALDARPSDARPPDDPAEPVAPLDEGFAVPDLAPAADLAAEPSMAPYEAADLVAEPLAEADLLAAPMVVPSAEPEVVDLPVDETDEPGASGSEPSDQSAWDQSAWAEPMPPSIPPATVTPAPSSAGAVVVTPGLGPVVAPLASGPDAAAPSADEPVPALEPVVQAELVAAPDVEPAAPAYPPVADLVPEPVVAPEVAPQVVAAPWQVDAAPDHALPDRAVPDPVWVPAPGPQEAPPPAQSAPAVPGWPVAVPAPAAETPSWQNQAPPVSAPEPFDNPESFGSPEPIAAPFPAAPPFEATPSVAEPPAAVWPEVSAQSEAPAPWLDVPTPPAQPEWSAFPAEAAHPVEPAPQPWAAAPVVPPAEPVGEPWGSAPALPGGWAPPPPPQWANLDPPSAPLDPTAAQVAAPPPFAAPGPELGAPVRTVGAEALDQSPAALTNVVIGVGGNLGPVQETLRWAVLRLGAMTGLEVVAVGPLARTAAVGSTDQPDYLNTVVLARTLLSPRDLLRRLQGVEREAGRERLERWGPRTLDLDIVTYGDLVVGDDELTLPHPRAHSRAFVLGPWASLDPDAVLPGPGGGPVARLADRAPDAEGVRWMALDWLTDTPGEPGAA